MGLIKDISTKIGDLVYGDLVLGSDSEDSGKTKNFTMEQIEEFTHKNVDKASMYSTAPVTTTLTTAGQYYLLTSANLASGILSGFTFLNGVFTFTGTDGTDFLFLGDANVETNKACELTFALYVNGVAVTGGTTPIDLAAVSKKESIGINIPVILNNGDTVEVWAKSDQATTALTVKTITTTLWR